MLLILGQVRKEGLRHKSWRFFMGGIPKLVKKTIFAILGIFVKFFGC